MRVLHCIWSMGGGGSERQLTYLAESLGNRGVEVHVIVSRGGANMARLEASGARIHYLNGRGRFDPTLFLRLYRLVRGIQPDLMQTWLWQMDVLGGLVARLTGIPWLLAERSSALAYPPGLRHRLRAVLGARLPAAIVSNSDGGDAYWRTMAKPQVIRRVIPNCVPIAAVEGSPRISALPDDRPLVLFAGRFSSEKNLPAIVKALAFVLPRFKARAALCGEGPMSGEIRQAVADADLNDDILMPGYVDNVWSWMRSAAVFVSAGFFEGDPNVVKEAIAARCPLVLSDIPSHRGLAGADGAIYVDPHHPESLAASIGTVLSDPMSARHRAEIAYERIAECSPERSAMMYEDLYRELLTKPLTTRREER